MDVEDLNNRNMETAIAQELEISMLCSSLVSLNICPNLVQVYSVFQSEFSPPEFAWRNGSRVPPLLKAGELSIWCNFIFFLFFYFEACSLITPFSLCSFLFVLLWVHNNRYLKSLQYWVFSKLCNSCSVIETIHLSLFVNAKHKL